MKRNILIGILTTILFFQIFAIYPSKVNTQEEYYVKIVDASITPNPPRIGDKPKFKITIEYKTPAHGEEGCGILGLHWGASYINKDGYSIVDISGGNFRLSPPFKGKVTLEFGGENYTAPIDERVVKIIVWSGVSSVINCKILEQLQDEVVVANFQSKDTSPSEVKVEIDNIWFYDQDSGEVLSNLTSDIAPKYKIWWTWYGKYSEEKTEYGLLQIIGLNTTDFEWSTSCSSKADKYVTWIHQAEWQQTVNEDYDSFYGEIEGQLSKTITRDTKIIVIIIRIGNAPWWNCSNAAGIEWPVLSDISEPVYSLRIDDVQYPSIVAPADLYQVTVTFSYKLPEKTQILIGLYDEDLESLLPTEPQGYFLIGGEGVETITLTVRAPPYNTTLNLAIYAIYWRNDEALYNENEGEAHFKIKVQEEIVESGKFIEVFSNLEGVALDDVSSIQVSVKLSTNETIPVTLMDGAIQVTVDAVKGEAIIKYIPSAEKLGLKQDQIPQNGLPLKLIITAPGYEPAELTVKLYKRPILLVHGTWSSSDTWEKMALWLREDGFEVYTADWPATESAIIVATQHLARRIEEVQHDFMDKYNANVTRIDIIAHSGGGLVSRAYIALRHDPRFWPGQKPPKALYVHTLILVGTTNLGSPLAPIYVDVLTGKFPLPPKVWALLMSTQAIPGHFTGKYGPLLEEQVPDSEFLTMLNSLPNDPNVRYYTICGTKNWLGGFLGRLIRFYGIHLYDRDLLEKLTGPGDGIVDLHSQRYPEKFGKGSGYYVYESHIAETSSREVFLIASNLLKDTPGNVAIYKTPLAPKLTVKYITPPPSESRFQIEHDGGFLGVWKTLNVGDELKPNEAIRITFSGQSPKPGESTSIMLEVSKMGKIEGRIIIRVKEPNVQKRVEIWVLSATALYIPAGVEVYIKYDGPITVITGTAALNSPDPEVVVAVDLLNQTKITLISGEIQVADLYNTTHILTPGMTTTTYPNKPMNSPQISKSYEKWWTEEASGVGFFGAIFGLVILGLIVLVVPIMIIILIIRRLSKKKPPTLKLPFTPVV